MDTEVYTFTGKRGTGKSQLARAILQNKRASGRAVVLDPMGHDYPNVPGERTFGDFASVWKEVRGDDRYQLRCTSPDFEDHIRVMDLVFRVQNEAQGQPVLMVVDEAAFFSSTGSIPEPVDRIVRAGRHANINLISIAQRTADLHPTVQANSDVVVFFWSLKPDTWTKELLRDPDRLHELDQVSAADETPELGRHYLTYPPEVDLEERLAGVMEG